MATTIIHKDSDSTIEITLKDETGTVIDINNLSGVVVSVFQENFLIDKFSQNAQAGFRTLNVKDAVNGVIELFLNANNLNKGMEDEPIYFEAKTQTVNANFDNAVEEKSSGAIKLAVLKATNLKNTTFI